MGIRLPTGKMCGLCSRGLALDHRENELLRASIALRRCQRVFQFYASHANADFVIEGELQQSANALRAAQDRVRILQSDADFYAELMAMFPGAPGGKPGLQRRSIVCRPSSLRNELSRDRIPPPRPERPEHDMPPAMMKDLFGVIGYAEPLDDRKAPVDASVPTLKHLRLLAGPLNEKSKVRRDGIDPDDGDARARPLIDDHDHVATRPFRTSDKSATYHDELSKPGSFHQRAPGYPRHDGEDDFAIEFAPEEDEDVVEYSASRHRLDCYGGWPEDYRMIGTEAFEIKDPAAWDEYYEKIHGRKIDGQEGKEEPIKKPSGYIGKGGEEVGDARHNESRAEEHSGNRGHCEGYKVGHDGEEKAEVKREKGKGRMVSDRAGNGVWEECDDGPGPRRGYVLGNSGEGKVEKRRWKGKGRMIYDEAGNEDWKAMGYVIGPVREVDRKNRRNNSRRQVDTYRQDMEFLGIRY
ncbi:hypothetical protein CAC42_7108 [Sphaceloma murrayae]|uniref:Uncharacterized protein n=1 Tax=Sphaceloma murrayae TaxID=2082308 RepID=A0A2K1QQV5_9PEZI|nr:hypothetical protein CAC42_7108 [Sphaceloma murrayae]